MADPPYTPPSYTPPGSTPPPYQPPPHPYQAMAPAPGAQPADPKAAKKARSAKLISYVVIALALLRLALWMLPAAPKACDDSDTQSSVEDAINGAIKKAGQTITLTGLSSIATLSTTDDLKQCRAQGSFSDGEKQPVFYSVTGKEVRAKVGSAP
jgi:hypothetical protein